MTKEELMDAPLGEDLVEWQRAVQGRARKSALVRQMELWNRGMAKMYEASPSQKRESE